MGTLQWMEDSEQTKCSNSFRRASYDVRNFDTITDDLTLLTDDLGLLEPSELGDTEEDYTTTTKYISAEHQQRDALDGKEGRTLKKIQNLSL
jgi:hypothetical protein